MINVPCTFLFYVSFHENAVCLFFPKKYVVFDISFCSHVFFQKNCQFFCAHGAHGKGWINWSCTTALVIQKAYFRCLGEFWGAVGSQKNRDAMGKVLVDDDVLQLPSLKLTANAVES